MKETEVVETKNELVVFVEESGVEKETGKTLLQNFMPFFEQIKEWEEKAQALVVTDATQLTEMKQARTARLALKDIRVDADKTRKSLKEDSLRYGKAVQGLYNLIEFHIVPIEKHLEEQEKFAENAEKKRKVALAEARTEQLTAYEVQTSFYDLANMAEADFQILLSNSKAGYEKRIEDKQREERERIERERVAEEKRQEIILENKRLKEEAERKEDEMKKEREAKEKELKAMQEKADKERRAAEAEATRIRLENEKKAAEEKARVDAEQKKMREKAQAKLEAERKEREKLAAELKEKELAEQKRIADAEAAKEAELSKGDADKIEDLKRDLEALKTKYVFKSAKNKKTFAEVSILLDKVVNHIIGKQ